MHHKRFAESNDALLRSGYAAFENQEIVFDNTVMRETTHRCNGLLRDVRFCGSIGLVISSTDPVDFLVELSTVVITVYEEVEVLSVMRTNKYLVTNFDQPEQQRT